MNPEMHDGIFPPHALPSPTFYGYVVISGSLMSGDNRNVFGTNRDLPGTPRQKGFLYVSRPLS